MRVLQVLDFAPRHAGGLVVQLAHLAAVLEDDGGRLHCAFPARRSWFDALGPRTRAFVLPEIRRPLRRGFARLLAARLRERRYDLIHLHFSFALPLALALAGRRPLPPLIYHWHNPPRALLPPRASQARAHQRLRRTLERRFGGAVARQVDRRLRLQHIVISPHISELLVREGWVSAHRIACIPNAVAGCAADGAGPAKVRSASRGDSGEIRIGSIMEFRPQKDHATLLRAFADLTRHHRRCRLILVGDGPGRPAAERLASDLGVRERVDFTGTLAGVQSLLARLDILAHATHYEGQCLAVLEAMSSALPIVASAVGGIPDMVADGREALLVPPRDPAAFARALGTLVADPALRRRLGAAGRVRAREAYSLERWGQRMLDVYAALLSSASDTAIATATHAPSVK